MFLAIKQHWSPILQQTAELIKAYGLRRPRRRRGCRAGRRAKPCPRTATSALDQSANCLAAAASRQSTTATTTTTTTTDDSAQSSVNNQLIANQSVNTGHDSLQELYQPIDNQLSHSSYESSHRIPTIISDRRCRNQLSSIYGGAWKSCLLTSWVIFSILQLVYVALVYYFITRELVREPTEV